MFDFIAMGDIFEYDDDKNLYGLYDLITNRFLYTNTNVAYLKMIAMLFSSRYRLYLCQLNCAKNWEPNLVDNEVATNWGINFKNYAAFNFAVNFDYLAGVYEVEELIELGPMPEDEIILKDVPYIQYITDLVSDLEDFTSSTQDGFNNAIDAVYGDMLSAPFRHRRTEFLNKEIFTVVYKEFDFQTAKEKIKHALTSYSN
jgi:hypothetical protein